MCIKTHSHFACTHEGDHQMKPCFAMFDPQRDFNMIPSKAVSRDFCCSQSCCQQAITFANELFTKALADEEAYDPSTLDQLLAGAFVKGQKKQLRQRLIAANTLRDEMNAKHLACQQMRSMHWDETSRMNLKQKKRPDVRNNCVMQAELEEIRALEAETKAAEKRGQVVYPIGAVCLNRPKGKGRVLE